MELWRIFVCSPAQRALVSERCNESEMMVQMLTLASSDNHAESNRAQSHTPAAMEAVDAEKYNGKIGRM
jgi:hypothetical protein